MGVITVSELLEKTNYTLFDQTAMPKAQRYSIGLEIEWKVPGFHPIDNVFHVHLDLIKRVGSEEIYIDNHTPKQMTSYRFWVWLENSATEDFMHQYLNKMFDRVHAESVALN